jgi:hypothetical protein
MDLRPAGIMSARGAASSTPRCVRGAKVHSSGAFTFLGAPRGSAT